ncbi:preprotein translocase subunit SecE [Fulvimonas sp. R45]|uniref:preprotein translocase subunit SecE n=1 Tax=Fulvimonas sp. R45 TaxID=3045937 RepID=UPI00266023E6|nr:preprotein translocase subunit SecE [Fulvimonas sp. R45]MDO1530616.1 preprotein translocase subunit SecE [Fulvimonas sp. R45]
MNTKAEQSKGASAGDIGKLVLAAVILAAGIVAYTWLGHAGVAQPVRLVSLLGGLVVALAVGAFTAPGRRVRNYIAESQFEMRKVVWPTRDETVKTTLIIIAVVVVLSLLLGLIDLILKSVILDWLLKLGE